MRIFINLRKQGKELFTISQTELTFSASQKRADAEVEYQKLDYYIIHCGYTQREISKIRSQRTTTISRYFALDEQCRLLEEELNITARWLPGTPEYERGTAQLSQREYNRAVDNLERLVVQRLFELTKLGMSGIGNLKLSSHIQI